MNTTEPIYIPLTDAASNLRFLKLPNTKRSESYDLKTIILDAS